MISGENLIQRLRPIAALSLTLVVLACVNVSAQRFQSVYGGPNWPEAGRAVTQLSTGGYVVVGETYSPSGGANSDIYVVVANPNGTVASSFFYNIGLNDEATDVIEDMNGFIVVCGTTDNSGLCSNGNRDIFVLKLLLSGGVVAVNTFGTATNDEAAASIVEAQYSAGGVTLPGDYIVAGSTTFQAGTGTSRDGYLIRMDQGLTLIWDQKYGGITTNDDFFNSVDEAPPIPPAPSTDADIVAVGATNTWGSGGYDYFIVRVDGSNGTIGASPENAVAYGDILDDIGHAVAVMSPPIGNNDLIFTGSSLNRPAPSANTEICMLRTAPDPIIWGADLFAGDNGTGADEGYDLKLDVVPPGAARVIVTGVTALGPFPPNAFLELFAGGTLGAFGSARAYGGNGSDVGLSVATCASGGAGQTFGYAVAGYTQSPNLIGTDPQQMYLIKTNIAPALNSSCNTSAIAFSTTSAGLTVSLATPGVTAITSSCGPLGVTPAVQPGQNLLCYALPKSVEPDNDESHALLATNEITITNYPNPVRSGEDINLRFDLKGSSIATITVSDIIGRVIHRAEAGVSAGSSTRAIETHGWPAGSYIIGVEIAGRRSTARIVVLDR